MIVSKRSSRFEWSHERWLGTRSAAPRIDVRRCRTSLLAASYRFLASCHTYRTRLSRRRRLEAERYVVEWSYTRWIGTRSAGPQIDVRRCRSYLLATSYLFPASGHAYRTRWSSRRGAVGLSGRTDAGRHVLNPLAALWASLSSKWALYVSNWALASAESVFGIWSFGSLNLPLPHPVNEEGVFPVSNRSMILGTLVYL